MIQDEAIHILPHDPTWPQKFAAERQLIEKTIGAYITGGVHHVGSTSIPGLSANQTYHRYYGRRKKS